MTTPSPARSRFAGMVYLPDEAIDLTRAALLVAVEDDPAAAVEPALAQLDQMAAGLSPTIAATAPRVQMESLAAHVHGAQGFCGNAVDYYHPANSLLTQVLVRRTGIPITLALVYMEVARQRGITLLPIGLPGHLVLRHAADTDVYLDPFSGDVLTARACLETVLGVEEAAQGFPSIPAPLGTRPFLLRLLNNLKGAYLRTEPPDLERALGASERILLLYSDIAVELRDRGMLRIKTGRLSAGLLDLEHYLARLPDAADAEEIGGHVQTIYQQLSRLN